MQFLKDLHLFLDLTKPVLLGFSGGLDSMALFSILDKWKNQTPIDLHLVHVDHKCRDQSTKEAHFLESLAKNKKIPFHLYTLEEGFKDKPNLEDVLRKERYKKFKQCYDDIKAGALLLAHHKNDLAETVLKRVLEGSYIANFVGLKVQTNFLGMNIVRPLLQYSKESLKIYAEQENLEWIEDKTNYDTQFLRAKIRLDMLPSLEKVFGKNISDNFVHLSSKMLQLDDYLNEKTQSYIENNVLEGPFGKCLDLSEITLHSLELEHLLRRVIKSYQVIATKDQITKILKAINQESADKKFFFKDLKIIVDLRRVFFLTDEITSFNQKYQISDFSKPILISKKKFIFTESNPSYTDSVWKMIWLGQVFYSFHEEPLILQPASLKCKSTQNFYSKYKIPSFLRKTFPLLVNSSHRISLPNFSKEENCKTLLLSPCKIN